MRSPYVHIFGKSEKSSSNSSHSTFTNILAIEAIVLTIPSTELRERVFHGDIFLRR